MGILFHIVVKEVGVCLLERQVYFQFQTWAKSYYTLIQPWFKCLPQASLDKLKDFSVLRRVTYERPKSPTLVDKLFENKGWVVGSAKRQGNILNETEVKVSLTVTGIVFGSEK